MELQVKNPRVPSYNAKFHVKVHPPATSGQAPTMHGWPKSWAISKVHMHGLGQQRLAKKWPRKPLLL